MNNVDGKNLLKKTTSFDYKSLIISFFIIILIFLFDRFSKFKIIENQLKNNSIYINDFLNFDLVWNTGIGFGLLSSNSTTIISTTIATAYH